MLVPTNHTYKISDGVGGWGGSSRINRPARSRPCQPRGGRPPASRFCHTGQNLLRRASYLSFSLLSLLVISRYALFRRLCLHAMLFFLYEIFCNNWFPSEFRVIYTSLFRQKSLILLFLRSLDNVYKLTLLGIAAWETLMFGPGPSVSPAGIIMCQLSWIWHRWERMSLHGLLSLKFFPFYFSGVVRIFCSFFLLVLC